MQEYQVHLIPPPEKDRKQHQKRKKREHKRHRRAKKFKNQIVPKRRQPNQPRKPARRKSEKLFARSQYLLAQDPRRSRFSHSKFLTMEKMSCLLTLLIFFLSCTKTELDVQTYDPNALSSKSIMYVISACTFGLILVIIMRYIACFEFQFDQNKVYLKKYPKQSWVFLFFTKSQKVKHLLLEILFILPHPIPLLQGKTFSLFQTYDEVYINHSYNDILALFLAAKVYIIVRALINLSTFSSPRAARLCYQNGFEHNLLYVLKCILNENPLTAITVNFVGLLMVFGYALKLSEGVLFLYNPGLITGFQDYGNCFWCVFITMATVGYGDYYPKTLPGRSVILITAISGVLLSSLLIVSLSLYLEMIPSQSKSHITLTRLGEQKDLAQEAANALTQTVKIQQLMSNPAYDDEKMRHRFQKLKIEIDATKTRSRKIKSLVDSDNIIQEMNRCFYILKDNLKDIFLGQLRLREEIGHIDQIQSIKLSFIREVEEMLSKASLSRKSSLDGSQGDPPQEPGLELTPNPTNISIEPLINLPQVDPKPKSQPQIISNPSSSHIPSSGNLQQSQAVNLQPYPQMQYLQLPPKNIVSRTLRVSQLSATHSASNGSSSRSLSGGSQSE